MPTLAEVEEALDHCRRVDPADRGEAWHAYVNALLTQRDNLVANRPALVR